MNSLMKRIPGFTAEASLYTTTERYQMAASNTIRTDNQAIIPQAWRCFRFGQCNFWCCLYDYSGQLIYCNHYRIC